MGSKYKKGSTIILDSVRIYGNGTSFTEYNGKGRVVGVEKSLGLFIYTVEFFGETIKVVGE